MENNWVMRNKWIFFVAPLAIAAFVALFGEIVMHLWNWLLPGLFGWKVITFWQAMGLLVLCRILFGGFGGHGAGPSKEHRLGDKRWGRLSPEDREKFRQKLRTNWCGSGEPGGETNEPA